MRTSSDLERWISGSEIDEAATITVCTGLPVAEVLAAFGARDEPGSLGEIVNEFSIDPWVAVRDLGNGAVLAFEDNGWQGSTEPTLRRASAAGSAASVYWNVEAVQALSFARGGTVLSSTRDFGWVPVPSEPAAVAEAVVGLDFSDRQCRRERGLIAAGRFTDRQVGPVEVGAVLAADRAYRILPWLTDHHPSGAGKDVVARQELAGAMIGPEFAPIGVLPDDVLADLAWSLAERVCHDTELLAHEPSAVHTVRQRVMTGDAELLARASTLESGSHRAGWTAIHDAANPDAFNAVLQVWSGARYIAGRGGEELLLTALTGR